jgi:hypothetical protein
VLLVLFMVSTMPVVLVVSTWPVLVVVVVVLVL